MSFELLSKKTVLKTYPFDVEELQLARNKRKLSHEYYRLNCRDWVNVLPITPENKAILIRQPRAGAMRTILEIPGGEVNADEKDPTMAAARELEEETGFTSQRILPLGALNPNPAIMNNRCHFFLALSCIPNPERQHFPDKEEFIEIVYVDISELEDLVRHGQLDHSLCAVCILLAQKYLNEVKP